MSIIVCIQWWMLISVFFCVKTQSKILWHLQWLLRLKIFPQLIWPKDWESLGLFVEHLVFIEQKEQYFSVFFYILSFLTVLIRFLAESLKRWLNCAYFKRKLSNLNFVSDLDIFWIATCKVVTFFLSMPSLLSL